MITEREKLEFESVPEFESFDAVPEFVREPRQSTRETYVTAKPAPAPKVSTPKAPVMADDEPIVSLPKSAELEALWPGVNHEFFHGAPKKGPSFYLTIGFMAGAIVSLIGAWGFSAATHLAIGSNPGKEIVVAQGSTGIKSGIAPDGRQIGTLTSAQGEPATIVPLASTYEVGTGDTLAGIALKNYKRATPRLLDEICRANNMRNANVLSLGQKLSLPEYHPQARQIATGGSSVQQ